MASIISAGTSAGTAIAISGDTSGNLAFQTQAGANTITVPNGTGTLSVQGVSTNIVSGTSVASTSGTSIDFTSIPSWVKRITVMFAGISTNGSSNYQIQLGAGSITTTGYLGSSSYAGGSNQTSGVRSTTGLLITQVDASTLTNGMAIITLLSGNTWVHQAVTGRSTTDFANFAAGSIALSGTLDRVRITTVNGTDTFDAGSINILYE